MYKIRTTPNSLDEYVSLSVGKFNCKIMKSIARLMCVVPVSHVDSLIHIQHVPNNAIPRMEMKKRCLYSRQNPREKK